MKKRIGSLALFVVILLACFPIGAGAVEADSKTAKLGAQEQNHDIAGVSDYESYCLNHSAGAASDAITLNNKNTVLQNAENALFSDEAGNSVDDAVIVKEDNGAVIYKFTALQTAWYCFEIRCSPKEKTGSDISFELRIDGSVPFSDCLRLTLPSLWQNSEEKAYVDEMKNEYAPEQKQVLLFRNYVVSDTTGAQTEPFRFYLESGEHTVTLMNFSEAVAIETIIWQLPETSKTYNELKNEYSKNYNKSSEGKVIKIEGESADLKTSREIVPKSDNSSPLLSPSSATHKVLNYIGDSNWGSPGEEVVWKISVPETGLYSIGIMFKQDVNTNMYSYRTLKIDGKIPFAECKELKFDYGIGWQSEILGNGEEDYYFYFEKGEHELSLSCTLGTMSEAYNKLRKTVSNIGDLYLDITMITGETPDKNRDYELFKQIPDLNDRLSEIYDSLNRIIMDLKSYNENQSNSLISAINNMSRVVKSMIDKPYTAHYYVSDYYDNYTVVSSWLYDMKSMPLSIDQIQLIPAGCDADFNKASFFGRFIFSAKRFLCSFSSDYSNISATKDYEGVQLKIWVNWGRDQAMVLNSLIQQSFVPETGIQVNLELTNATLVKGMLSNNAPDLSLHLSRTEPVNLAMRGALYDLTQFDDYDEVVKRFSGSASVPYEYGDGVYALPDTQSFYIMFYRSDILDSLGISVPETWDDFLSAVSVLQRNNMNAWLPYTQITAANTVNSGVGGLNMFASILQQYGCDFYNSERNKTTLTSDDALKAFCFWTDMYTEYKVPTTATFYNRFRTGTMPLGIEAYTLYTTLSEAAPEIEGRWGIALVPGVERDGKVDHTVAGSGTGCVILNTSKHKDAAWEFLKWWTSADIQLQYNNNVESIIGTVSRTTTATLKTFEKMSWEKNDLEILLNQRKWIKEIPEVPGSYYVSRSVDQAFWSVINQHNIPKDVLKKWGTIADKEISRKISEYQ